MSEQMVTRAEFEALRAEIALLREQLATLNVRSASAAPPEEISEETLHIIAATIAAYLGKRATIRFIRRVNDESTAWRTQGRATVAASHRMPRIKGW